MRLFENINIKHYNIMNSRKTSINQNAAPNTASINKDILFHVSKFLEIIVFQLMFEILK